MPCEIGTCPDDAPPDPALVACDECGYAACAPCLLKWMQATSEEARVGLCAQCTKPLDRIALARIFTPSQHRDLKKAQCAADVRRMQRQFNADTEINIVPLVNEVERTMERIGELREALIARAPEPAPMAVDAKEPVAPPADTEREALVTEMHALIQNVRAELKRINELPLTAPDDVLMVDEPVEKRRKKSKVEKRVFACPRAGCRGAFGETTRGRCRVCEKDACLTCLLEKNEGHMCALEALATAELKRETSQTCPGCYTSVTKTEGCAVVQCVCGMIFEYETGRPSQRAMTNPHLYMLNEQDRVRALKVMAAAEDVCAPKTKRTNDKTWGTPDYMERVVRMARKAGGLFFKAYITTRNLDRIARVELERAIRGVDIERALRPQRVAVIRQTAPLKLANGKAFHPALSGTLNVVIEKDDKVTPERAAKRMEAVLLAREEDLLALALLREYIGFARTVVDGALNANKTSAAHDAVGVVEEAARMLSTNLPKRSQRFLSAKKMGYDFFDKLSDAQVAA